jgi:tetratricopeptide (TPR) repeat protein
MAGPFLAAKAAEALIEELGALLNRYARRLDELTLHRVLASAEKALDATPAELRGQLYSLMGHARYRLGDYELALKWFRWEAIESPDLAQPLSSIACCLLKLGDPRGALKLSCKARTKPIKFDGQELRLLAHEAEAHFRLGQLPESRRALESATRHRKPRDPDDWFILAFQAAVIGADDESLEFLTRHAACSQKLPAGPGTSVEFIRSAAPELLARVAELPELDGVLSRAASRDPKERPQS